MTPLPSIPTFVVVGQPNEGKTTVMATLTENDLALIGPMPGTTTKAHRYPVRLDDREALVFWDTPGFENAGSALEWFRAHGSGEPNPAAAFVERFSASGKFKPECAILRQIAEGAAVIHVVDASRPVRDVDRWEIELLRRCGNPRIGVINRKEQDPDHFLEEWHRVLATDFNHRHEFDAHRASFRDRMRLLEAVRAVLPEWRDPMDLVLDGLRKDWNYRLGHAAAILRNTLRKTLKERVRESARDTAGKAAAQRRADEHLKERIREFEQEARSEIRRLFRHTSEHWSMDELQQLDLFSREAWRLYGLSRPQLVGTGAAAGCLVGGMVDAHTGGSSFLAGAIAGIVVGGTLGWAGTTSAVKHGVPDLRIGWHSHSGSRINVETGIRLTSNLVWVLLDRLLAYTASAASWAHGRRHEEILQVSGESEKHGHVSGWPTEDRLQLIHLLRQRGSGVESADRNLQILLQKKLNELIG